MWCRSLFGELYRNQFRARALNEAKNKNTEHDTFKSPVKERNEESTLDDKKKKLYSSGKCALPKHTMVG